MWAGGQVCVDAHFDTNNMWRVFYPFRNNLKRCTAFFPLFQCIMAQRFHKIEYTIGLLGTSVINMMVQEPNPYLLPVDCSIEQFD